MSNERVRQVLAGEIGLAADVLGTTTLGRAVLDRMRALGIPTVDAYSERLEKDRGERSALIEDIVVPETWFFRDGEPFRVIARMVREWQPGRLLRALSMPCATGEEPYSLVMTLVEDGFDLERLAITAVDVSARSLERARRGVYGRNSFRGGDDASLIRSRHFRPAPPGPSGEEWQLDERIRRCVELVQGNALGLAGLVRGPFDVILCRNLLIYLTAEARARVLTSLVGLLSEEGLLVVGHADLIDSRAYGLALHGDPSGFAYTRASVVPPPARHDTAPMPSLAPEAATRLTPAVSSAPRTSSRAVSPQPVPREETPLQRARGLADRGDLAAAATLLVGLVDQLGPDGDAYHLLGMVESARGDRAAAEKYLSRALYCDPSNQATLLQLALLAEHRGDAPAAANFRRRAARLRSGGRP
ncbi:MAG TPA: CheR family methyltransferase [Kofleriaceae bacterium]|nr:CheR family methyltransferase [Kofleriaceae bacterium]